MSVFWLDSRGEWGRLNIVCCHVPGQLRPETETALNEALWETRLRPTCPSIRAVFRVVDPSDDKDYGRQLSGEWTHALEIGASLAIVEPDIVVRPDVITAFCTDPADYLCFPYAWKTDVGPALGCTRFSAAFIERYPKLLRDAVLTGVGWQQLDVVIMRHLLARKYGEQPKVCLPPVEHLNEAKALLPEASPEPLMTVPHW